MVEKDVVLINTVKAILLQHKLLVTIVLHIQNKKCCPKHFVKELFWIFAEIYYKENVSNRFLLLVQIHALASSVSISN